MSDTMGAADQFAAAIQGQSGTDSQQTDPGPDTQQQQPTQQQPTYSPYAQQFLQNVPEEHRPIIGEHLQKWDAGFTRYAQQVQQKISQYESLGDPQTLQQAVTYWNQLVNDPNSVVELLIQNGFGPRQAQQMVQNAQNPQQQQDPFADYPDHVKQRFQAVDQIQQQNQEVVRALGLIAEKINTQERMAQEAEYDRQLDQVLGQMKSQYGNFDEMYVLTQISAGVPPDQAVQKYQQLAQSILNERGSKQAPQVISGNSLPTLNQPLETQEQRTNALVAALKGMGYQ